tara:strand:+ start:2079 stop:2321 length:243 start_codon:yes stop_codon:yes gene_type:complete
MDNSIHNVLRIVKGEIARRTTDSGEVFFRMEISIFSEVLGNCKNMRDYDDTMIGYMEVETELTLFADTIEALEIKAEALA